MIVDTMSAGLTAASSLQRVTICRQNLQAQVGIFVSELELLYGFAVQLIQLQFLWRQPLLLYTRVSGPFS